MSHAIAPSRRDYPDDLLRQREERFEALVQNSSDVISVLTADGQIVYQSSSALRVFGHPPDELIGQDSFARIHPDDGDAVREAFRKLLDDPGETLNAEYRIAQSDGSWRWIESTGSNLLDHPAVRGVVINSRDVSARKEAEARLAEAERRFRILAEHLPAATYIEPLAGSRVAPYNSPRHVDITGYPPETSWDEIIHPDDRERRLAEIERVELAQGARPYNIDYRIVRADGAVRWVHNEAILVRDDDGMPLYWQGIVTDITERKQLEAQLAHQVFHDALTGLPNRVLFHDLVSQAMARASRRGGLQGVLFVDLDGFKLVNDQFGHATGDQLLVAVAKRLLAGVRAGDTVARMSGDEFTVLLEDIDADGEAVRVAERVVEAMHLPFEIGGRQISVTASVGIAVSPGNACDPSDLIRRADMAMYEAKRCGKARYAVFDPATQTGQSGG